MADRDDEDDDDAVYVDVGPFKHVELVDEAQMAEIEFSLVICVLGPPVHPLYFTDNVVAPCHDCARPIQYRPNLPKTGLRVCMECASVRVMSQGN